jgi:hypothetical protein
MNNTIINYEIPEGSIVSSGVPAERPEAAIAALEAHFQTRPKVAKAFLGLTEIVRPGQEGQFTYTIGIVCDDGRGDLGEEAEAYKVLTRTPMGRWPITIFPKDSNFFTLEAICFYERKPVKVQKSGSWLSRLLG